MPLDETDFVDRDYQAARGAAAAATGGTASGGFASGYPPAHSSPTRRAPTREELDSQLTATQQQLAKLREAQEQLERARAAVEDLRRRRADFHRGRDELRDCLTGGVARLEKAELETRRDADQMARTLEGLRSAQVAIQNINEGAWTEESWDKELGRSLTVIENARMEWNGARLKWPILDGVLPVAESSAETAQTAFAGSLTGLSFAQLCRIGLAFTWPLVLVALLILAAGVLIWFKR